MKPVIVKPSIGYARTSTDRQDNSIGAQESTIRAMAALRGAELSEVVIDPDEFSGSLERPGVRRIMDLVRRKQVSAVLITKLDRLTRSTRDVVDLIELFSKSGVALVSHYEALDTESPMGRFFVRMIASIAELEREMIGERTRAGMAHIKRQGFPTGTAPYGWQAQPRTAEERDARVRKPLLEDIREQGLINLVKDYRKAGESLPSIARLLNEAGHRTRRGGLWSYQGVANILSAQGASAAQ
jgi:site-specific DNA recombinase